MPKGIKKPGFGALPDPRKEEEKLKDYKFEEIVAAANPVTWIEKTDEQLRKFPIFNQDGSGSCVAQTMAKLLGILYFLKNQLYVHFSATHIYQRRQNKPGPGMWGVDAFNIAKQGVTLEELAPSQKMTDKQMDGAEIPQYKQEVGQIFKIGNYLTVPVKNIDTIASIIQATGKAVMVWFFFKIDEWTDEPKILHPELTEGSPEAERHSVTATDFLLRNGKKTLVIEDSWGPNYGVAGRRFIDEDFFKTRNFFAAYPMNFKFDEQAEKPHYTFQNKMAFGDQNADVKALQDILKYEGLFPQNTESTGLYGAITAKGVYQFQVKYQVAPQAELDQLKGRSVGAKTLAKLNQLYG